MSGPVVTFHGIWGVPTANVDWCERNYAVSPALAEFWNSVSSLPMVFWGLFGMWKVSQVGLGRRFVLLYFFLGLVGIGSTLFHATLLYSAQLLDELPMILGSLVLVFVMIELNHLGRPPHQPHTEAQRQALALALTAYGVATCVVMATFAHSPLPMNVSYVLMVAFLVYSTVRTAVGSVDRATRVWALTATLSYLAGAVFWLYEKNFCRPHGPTQYYHALWHLLAGFGTYCFDCWLSYIHSRAIYGEHAHPIVNPFLVAPYLDGVEVKP